MKVLYNNQMVFDLVKKHLFTQGKAALNEENECQYRATDGSRCAIGTLIPDCEYDSAMEGLDVEGLKSNFPSYYDNYFSNVDLGLLMDLQDAHDGAAFSCLYKTRDERIKYWEVRFAEIAKRYGLDNV